MPTKSLASGGVLRAIRRRQRRTDGQPREASQPLVATPSTDDAPAEARDDFVCELADDAVHVVLTALPMKEMVCEVEPAVAARGAEPGGGFAVSLRRRHRPRP